MSDKPRRSKRASGARADGVNAKSHASMVTLKPVGVTEDGAYVTLARRADAKSGGWRIAVDDDLVAHLEEAVARAYPPPPEPPPQLKPRRADSKLSPKEIQALLRQGRSAAAIAKKAGVSVQWVERFAVPIVWERRGMVDRARKATLVRARRGPSDQPLGTAVEATLRERGIRMSPDEFDQSWDAVRSSRGTKWIVGLRYSYRGRDVVAKWELDPESGEIKALDKLAADLGWIEPKAKGRTSSR